jgi:hypothetical protein
MREAARSPLAATTPFDDGADGLLAQATVAAAGTISLALADVEALRANPGSEAQPAVAKALRNADEQTVAGAVALLRAIASRGWSAESFRNWAIIGCPRFLGRMIITGLLTRYFEDAKYSINPHVIPNYSLHSTSGAVSVGFTMHGPNFGVGGGPGNLPEGLLTGLSLVGEGRHPGVWVLLCEFDPEPRPDKAGKPTNAVNVHAVAFALTNEASPLRDQASPLRLRLFRRPTNSAAPPMVRDLASFLTGDDTRSPFHCPVDGLGVIEFDGERTR